MKIKVIDKSETVVFEDWFTPSGVELKPAHEHDVRYGECIKCGLVIEEDE